MRLTAPGRTSSASILRARRRALAVIVTACLALGSAAGLAAGLVSCGPKAGDGDQTRPLSSAEAARLAAMRLHNFQDGRAGVRGAFGHPGEEIRIAGWIDWQRPLAYLSLLGPTAGPADGLVQAMPGLIAARPGRWTAAAPSAPGAAPSAHGHPSASSAAPPAVPGSPPAGVPTGTPEQPPAQPPSDGWRLRPFGPTGTDGVPLDGMLHLLLTIAAEQADTADLRERSDTRWLGTDEVAGVPVDVLLGPAVPFGRTSPAPAQGTPQPTSTASPGAGVIRYWLDAEARLHRLDAVVGHNLPLRLDFERSAGRELTAVDVLGGRTVAPRPVTAAEAEMLARLRQRNATTGGGTFTVRLPGETGDLLTAAGWLDWRLGVAYLAVQDTDDEAAQTLMRADRAGVWVLTGARRTLGGRPPLPPPAGAWKRALWEQRHDARGASDLDLLLGEALTMSHPAADDAHSLRTSAVRLRSDTIEGAQVSVYELPRAQQRGVPAGSARMRYWIDSAGLLRRLEVRGRSGGFGQLDLRLSDTVPALPPVQPS